VACQTRFNICGNLGLFAAAGNIKHQSVRRIKRHHWRIAITAIGYPFEQGGVCGGIMGEDAKPGCAGTSISER
jgi:hypothetical protein